MVFHGQLFRHIYSLLEQCLQSSHLRRFQQKLQTSVVFDIPLPQQIDQDQTQK